MAHPQVAERVRWVPDFEGQHTGGLRKTTENFLEGSGGDFQGQQLQLRIWGYTLLTLCQTKNRKKSEEESYPKANFPHASWAENKHGC